MPHMCQQMQNVNAPNFIRGVSFFNIGLGTCDMNKKQSIRYRTSELSSKMAAPTLIKHHYISRLLLDSLEKGDRISRFHLLLNFDRTGRRKCIKGCCGSLDKAEGVGSHRPGLNIALDPTRMGSKTKRRKTTLGTWKSSSTRADSLRIYMQGPSGIDKTRTCH